MAIQTFPVVSTPAVEGTQGSALYSGTITGLTTNSRTVSVSMAAGNYILSTKAAYPTDVIVATGANGYQQIKANTPTTLVFSTTETSITFTALVTQVPLSLDQTSTIRPYWSHHIPSVGTLTSTTAGGGFALYLATDGHSYKWVTDGASIGLPSLQIYMMHTNQNANRFLIKCVTTAANFAFSTNATTWTLGTIPFSPSSTPQNITYNSAGKFIAIAPVAYSAASSVQVSTNGTTWTAVGINWLTTDTVYSVQAGGGTNQYVIGGQDTGGVSKLTSSTDAVTWATRSIGNIGQIDTLLYITGRWFAGVQDSSSYAYSTDAVTWTTGTLPATPGGRVTVDWVNNKFWFVTTSLSNLVGATVPAGTVYYSTDAVTWTLWGQSWGLQNNAFTRNGISSQGSPTTNFSIDTDGLPFRLWGWSTSTYMTSSFVKMKPLPLSYFIYNATV